jgi:hypothetical protein
VRANVPATSNPSPRFPRVLFSPKTLCPSLNCSCPPVPPCNLSLSELPSDLWICVTYSPSTEFVAELFGVPHRGPIWTLGAATVPSFSIHLQRFSLIGSERPHISTLENSDCIRSNTFPLRKTTASKTVYRNQTGLDPRATDPSKLVCPLFVETTEGSFHSPLSFLTRLTITVSASSEFL